MSPTHINKDISDLEKERDIIVQLINLSKEIMGHTNSLQDVWLLAKPSQDFPKRVQKYKSLDDWEHTDKPPTELLSMSKSHDKQTSDLLDQLLSIVTETKLIIDLNQSTLPESLKKNLGDFSYATRMSVLARILLQEEGIVLPAAKFSISQEVIGEQISRLLDSNRNLRKNIKQRIKDFSSQIKQLICSIENSSIYKPWLLQISNKLDSEEHSFKASNDWASLARGLVRLPLHHITSHDEKHFVKTDMTVDQADKSQNPVVLEHVSQFSTIKKLGIWLNTGWNTKWKDIG